MNDFIELPPLPIACPSCASALTVCELACPQCNTQVHGGYPLPPFLQLSAQDQEFINQFVLASGSLKSLAKTLGVSYPTVRNRLDDVIERLQTKVNERDKP